MKKIEEQSVGKIVLASNSPRRRQIMTKYTDYYFEVIPSPYEEKHTTTVFSLDYVENLAYQKALSVVPLVNEENLIIGADTVVVLNNEILGKPKDYDDAFLMLKKLSGKKHQVVTSIVVINSKTKKVKKNSTVSIVEFETLTDVQIKYYLDNFKPFDKAGSYGIQEMPIGYIKGYEGSLENIIGLCPNALKKLIEQN